MCEGEKSHMRTLTNMTSTTLASDAELLEMLRSQGPLSVSEMACASEVTPTSVRQRLSRLLAQGLIARQAVRVGRGRPKHRYHLTDKGLRLTGSNFTDLALALWREIQSIEDQATRGVLFDRVIHALASGYARHIVGRTLEERMRSLSELLAERRVPFTVDSAGQLPVLTAHACPYPELAEADPDICGLEKALFSSLLGEKVELTQCRLQGGALCQFQPT